MVKDTTTEMYTFLFLFQFPVPFEHPLVRPCNHGNAWSFSLYPPPRSFLLVSRERGALEGYSLSMSLYFFLSMDTWSLNRTGSNLI